MLPLDEIELLKHEIEAKTKLNLLEAYKLALWIYRRDNPGFNDEVMA